MQKLTAILLLLISLPALAAKTAPAAITQGELGRILLGLLIVVGIIMGLAWVLKRVNAVQLGSNKAMKILATYGLGTRERLLLVQVADRYLLLGVTSAAINTLHDFGTTLPEGLSDDTGKGFGQVMQQVLRKRS